MMMTRYIVGPTDRLLVKAIKAFDSCNSASVQYNKWLLAMTAATFLSRQQIKIRLHKSAVATKEIVHAQTVLERFFSTLVSNVLHGSRYQLLHAHINLLRIEQELYKDIITTTTRCMAALCIQQHTRIALYNPEYTVCKRITFRNYKNRHGTI